MRRLVLLFVLVLSLLPTLPLSAADDKEDPRLEHVREAMQDRDYKTAVTLLQQVLDGKPAGEDFWRYLLGLAQGLAGDHAAAVATFQEFAARHADSPWRVKAAFRMADALAKQGKFAEAVAIYEPAAVKLASADRRQEIADLYVKFAEPAWKEAEQLATAANATPEDKQKAQQLYAKAAALWQKAVDAGLKPEREPAVTLLIARCQIATGAHAGAATRLAAEKKKHPKSDVADQVAYYLGFAHFSANQMTEARRAFQDFLADFPQSALAAQAAYRLGLTYGLPNPTGRGWLELGVKAHRDYVARFPTDAHASQADFDVAVSYFNARLLDDAIRELTAFIDKYRTEEKASQVPPARSLLGTAYRLQKKWADAARVWQEFLKAHPTHKDWSAVQRQLLDLEYEIGADFYAQKKYDEAKDAWLKFLDAHPLDPRCPETLYALGQIEHDRKEWQAALDAWGRLVSKYPGTEPASHAQFQIGYTLELSLHKFADAIDAYKKCNWGEYAGQAQARIQEMEAKKLVVLTERTFRSNETPALKVTTRNMEKLQLKVYKLDLESYFRKMHSLRGVDTLDISLIKPDQTVEVPVKDFEKYRELEWSLPLPVKGEGAWAINLGDESFEATTLVVVSDLAIISKSTRREVFVFAQDMLQKKARAGAKVLVSDGKKVVVEGTTDANGIYRKDLEELKTAGEVRVFALAGGSPASDEMPLGGVALAAGLEPRGFVYSDRPGYRPGDTVRLRAILRRVESGTYTFAESEEYDVQVVAPTGEALHTATAKLSATGALELAHTLDPNTPLGTYRVIVSRKNGPTFNGAFEVQDYPFERIGLTIHLEREVLFRGEPLKGTISASYYYGEPVAGRLIRYQVGDLPPATATTDAKGEVKFEISTRDFAESQPVPITAAMDEEGISQAATAFVSTTGFGVALTTVRGVYLVGEPFEVTVAATDPAGKPVEVADLKLSVVRLDGDGDHAAETEVKSESAATAKADGKAHVTVTLDKGGRYLLRARGTDRFGNTIAAVRDVYVSGDDDTTKVRILSDHDEYKVGDEPKVRLVNRAGPNLALVTYEGERIYKYQVIDLAAGEQPLPLAMTDDLAPNFVLAVAVMDGEKFHAAAKEFLVLRGLTVKLTTAKAKYAPGEEVEVSVETTDPLGRPVSAELSLAMVDEGLYAVAPDALPAITDFFYGQRRGVSVATATSCTWKHEAKTVAAVPELLEELKRMEELREREREFERMRDRARREVARVSNGAIRNPDATESSAVANANEAFDQAQAQTAGGQVLYFGSDTQTEVQQDAIEDLSRAVNLPVAHGSSTITLRDRNGNLITVDARQLGQRFGNRGQQAAQQPGPQGQVAYRRGLEGKPAANPQPGQPQGKAGSRFVALGLGRGAIAAGPGPLAAIVRAHFPDTGYWNPAVVTDKNGKASVKFKLPDNTTAWRLTAYGASRETLVGKGTSSLTARKDFFVDLKLPELLVEGDKPRLQARVVNGTDTKGKATLELKALIGTKVLGETKTVDVDAHGAADVEFAIAVPVGAETGDARSARITLAGGMDGADGDIYSRLIGVDPWGTEIRRGAGGIAASDRVEFLELPAKDYARRALRIVLGGSPDRTLLDLVGADPADDLPSRTRSLQPLGGYDLLTRGSAASEGLTLLAVLDYLDATGRGSAGDRRRIEARLAAIVQSLAVTQNDDGGWSWSVSGRNVRGSDPHTSADGLRLLSGLKKKGYPIPAKTVPAAVAYLKTAYAAGLVEDSKAILLFALAHENEADFAFVNRLYRDRNRLSTYSLALLTLTFQRMGRAELAAEVAAMVEAREPMAGIEHPRDREAKCCIWIDDDVEARAFAALALESARPKSPRIQELVDWLLAHRWGTRWASAKGTAAAAAALAGHLATTAQAAQRYTLAIKVNGKPITQVDVNGAAGTTVVEVPADALVAGKNKIELGLEGTGRFAYSAVLSGFTREIDNDALDKHVQVRRKIIPAPLTLEGREIPRGYSVLTGSYQEFDNPVTQLPAGRFAQVELSVSRLQTTEGYLVLEEYVPAGASVLPGTVSGDFDAYEVRDGRILFYLGERRDWATVRYRLGGSLPGDYRVRRARCWSLYQPERVSTFKDSALAVLARDAKSADAYRMTPDELFHLGKGHFDKDAHDAARGYLTELIEKWRLNDATIKETARMLLLIAVADLDAARRPAPDCCREIVKFSEILRERFQDVVLSFETTLKIGHAYETLGEHERALQVFRAVCETLFARDSVVAADLEAQGEYLASVDFLLNLNRGYPDLPTVETAHLSLAQGLYQEADHAREVPELVKKKISGEDLIRRAAERLREFLTLYPENPSADGAAFSLAVAYFDLGKQDDVVALCGKLRTRYPKSQFLDNYLYLEGYASFRLEKLDRALELLRRVATEKFPSAAGDLVESENKAFSTFIVGQIYESMGKPDEAIAEYTKVKDQIPDAKDSIEHYEHKALSLPEVTNFKVKEPVKIKVKYRNCPKAEIVAYKVDLMKLYLIRKNLDRIAGIQLAGIDPMFRKEVELGKGHEVKEAEKEVELPIAETGAYLIVAKGEEQDASGMVLVSALETEVEVDPAAGRVRVNVQDVATGRPAVRAHVKVVGAADGQIRSGYTDLRGVYICDDVHGQCTVIVSRDNDYAFHRGRTPLQVAMKQGKGKAAPSPAQTIDLFSNMRAANDDWNGMNRANLNKIQEQQKQQGEAGCKVEQWK